MAEFETIGAAYLSVAVALWNCKILKNCSLGKEFSLHRCICVHLQTLVSSVCDNYFWK